MTWREDLIKYRRERAAETLEDARMMFERKRLFSAVNRIYYAFTGKFYSKMFDFSQESD